MICLRVDGKIGKMPSEDSFNSILWFFNIWLETFALNLLIS